MNAPGAPDYTTAFARTFVDECVRAGIRHAVVSPGSRSTPLALALAQDGRIHVHVFLDERSASFFALGIGRASASPAVLLCTSGSAAAHFHPAIVEADLAGVPMLVCTADRPPELRDTGAPQTIDQVNLYGRSVRWFADLAAPDGASLPTWRPLVARAIESSVGGVGRPGPVHLNIPLREPLVPTGAPVPATPGRNAGAPYGGESRRTLWLAAPTVVTELASMIAEAPRGIITAGWDCGVTAETIEQFSRASGWPILADAISGVRVGERAISTYDAFLRVAAVAERVQAQAVLRVGGPLTSKVAGAWVDRAAEQIAIDEPGRWRDPSRVTSRRINADAEHLLAELSQRLAGLTPTPAGAAWEHDWYSLERVARLAIDQTIDAWSDPFEGRVARDTARALPDGSVLLAASSMPVRDLEWFAEGRANVRLLSNRGTNGIDGFVSTVLGLAAATERPVVGLGGDLAFLHDANGLLDVRRRRLDATFVIVDNHGGGIFSFLPQARLPADLAVHYETLWGTPHGIDLAALTAVHGIETRRVEAADDVTSVVREAIERGGIRVILIDTDRADNVRRHELVWQSVERAVSGQHE